MTVEQLLYDEMKSLADDLKGLEPNSKEYKIKSGRLDGLIAKAVEMDKTYLEADLKREQMEFEHEDKQKEMDENKVNRLVNSVLQGLSIALPIAVTIWGTNKSLKFEETGTVTTMAGRGFISKLFPKK